MNLPRPLWMMKEELAEKRLKEPPRWNYLAHSNWAAEVRALEEWVALGESIPSAPLDGREFGE